MMSRPPIWLVVLFYAIFSILWIVIAGSLISLTLDDPVLRSRAYLAKELILVAVSSGLFYLLLKFGKETVVSSGVNSVTERSRLNRLMLMFLSLAMVAPLVSIGIVKIYGPELERRAYADLQTIVDLKAEQIELWLAERRGDAEAIAVSQAFVERVANMQNQKDGHHRQLIRNRLDAVRNAYSYESVQLLDTDGQPLLVLGEQRKLPAVTQACCRLPCGPTGYRAAICSWMNMEQRGWIFWYP